MQSEFADEGIITPRAVPEPKPLCLVTGANGHLGNTLVRALLDRGFRVRAGVRNLQEAASLDGLACERVQLELLDTDSLDKALRSVDVLYQVAAAFRHWARDPEREIVRPNVEGSRLILQAAATAGVRRVVYVSSVAAVGHTGQPLDETHWNVETENPYYRSKIESEQAAWETARRLGVNMVTVLPSAMVGPNAFRQTDTMRYLDQVRKGKIPLDPDFRFNFVDVRDVAVAMTSAAERGVPGKRYILANTDCSTLTDIVKVLRTETGGARVPPKLPPKPPRWLLKTIAALQQASSRVTGRAPELLASQVRLFHGVRQVYDSSLARRELGFAPRSSADAIAAGLAWLQERETMQEVSQ